MAIGGAGLLGAAASQDAEAVGAPTLDDHLRLATDASNFRAGSAALLAIGGAAMVAGVVVFALEARKRPMLGAREARLALGTWR